MLIYLARDMMILCYLYELENGIKTVRFYWMKRTRASEREKQKNKKETTTATMEKEKKEERINFCAYKLSTSFAHTAIISFTRRLAKD